MSNPFFRFKHFTVWHDKCAMKVGTDGVLLGAWANGGERILDVGTGSGLIAIMMAQRFANAKVTAIDIDGSACSQAVENVAMSPFHSQIEVKCIALQEMTLDADAAQYYDAVVCNPPFFENALKTPDKARTVARHNDQLPFSQLFDSVKKVITVSGTFSLIIPAEYKERIMEEAAIHCFFNTKECAVKTTPKKQIRRFLLEFSLSPANSFAKEVQILEMEPGRRSTWYHDITQDFYL